MRKYTHVWIYLFSLNFGSDWILLKLKVVWIVHTEDLICAIFFYLFIYMQA